MNIKTYFLFSILAFATLSQSCCDLNTIKVSGNADVKVKPDFATIEIGAQAKGDTTSQALSNLNEKMNGLMNIIRRNGIPDEDFSTSSLTLSQVTENRNGQSVVVGQKASQTLSVKIRNILEDEKIGFLIDTASFVDGVIINGVTFDVIDKTLGLKQARKAAFAAAKKKADQYAELSGMRVRKANKITDLDSGRIIPFYANAVSFNGDFKTLVPVKDVIISASVDVWFTLLP